TETWRDAAAGLANGALSLLGLWGEEGTVHMALLDEETTPSAVAVLSLACPDGRFPSIGVSHAPAIRLERAIRDLCGTIPMDSPPLWSVAGSGGVGRISPRRTHRAVSVPAGRRRGPASDTCRPGSCRHHRAGPFPFHCKRRDRREAGAAPRLCAQGHRVPD